MYYLNSRYYNPEWGRSLNADAYLNANGDIIGFNMFAYCGNEPVGSIDPTGSRLDRLLSINDEGGGLSEVQIPIAVCGIVASVMVKDSLFNSSISVIDEFLALNDIRSCLLVLSANTPG